MIFEIQYFVIMPPNHIVEFNSNGNGNVEIKQNNCRKNLTIKYLLGIKSKRIKIDSFFVYFYAIS